MRLPHETLQNARGLFLGCRDTSALVRAFLRAVPPFFMRVPFGLALVLLTLSPMHAFGKAKIRPEKDTLFLPYQAKWIEDKSRLKICEKSRQIGWTWCTAYRLVREKSRKEARLDAWISSRDDIQARLFLEDCKSFASLLHIGAKDLGERAIDDQGHSAYVLAFANTLRAHSMSSNPDAQAGKRGDRVLDEFALHPDPRKLYSIAFPGITWGGSMEIFSTHRGSANFFNELLNEVKHKGNRKGFSHHKVTLQDALDEGFLYKLQSKLPEDDERQQMDEAEYFTFIRDGCADEESFLQEYMCVPADDQSAFLTYDLIAANEYRGADAETQYEIHRDGKVFGKFDLGNTSGDLYMGIDVGRTRDLTVFWIDEIVGGLEMARRIVELQNMPFSQQEAILYQLLALPNLRRASGDNTGIGRQMIERAQERFGKYKVEAVTFTGPVKEALAYPVRSAFEDKTCRMPEDKLIRADFRGIRKETTAAGNVRFAGEKTANGHSDRFWAKALAKHAAKPAAGAFGGELI